MLTIGLIVNPIAGIGGPLGLKGSDSLTALEISERKLRPHSPERTTTFLETVRDISIDWVTWGGLGDDELSAMDLPYRAFGNINASPTALDTQSAVTAFCEKKVDLIVFVGGDGTATDVLNAVEDGQLCLGIPAGVKIHSGVFAVSPQAAGEIVRGLAARSLVAAIEREVRDFSVEEIGQIRIETKGVMLVPEAGGYLQHTKEGGRESEALVCAEIGADLTENFSDSPILFGPGGTVAAVAESFGGQEITLRGFDFLDPAGRWSLDLDESAIGELLTLHPGTHVVLSFTRTQGFLLGRGNQQLSADLIRRLDWQRQVSLVTTRTKLASLEQRPLLVDTGDTELDKSLAGLNTLVTGYEDRIVYEIRAANDV